MYFEASTAPGSPVRLPSSLSEARYSICRRRFCSTLSVSTAAFCPNAAAASARRKNRTRKSVRFIVINIQTAYCLLLTAYCSLLITSLYPIGNKYVSIAGFCVISVRCKDKLFPVRREHRKTVKRIVVSHAFESRAVRFDQSKIKVAFLRIGREVVRAKNDPLAVRRE